MVEHWSGHGLEVFLTHEETAVEGCAGFGS